MSQATAPKLNHHHHTGSPSSSGLPIPEHLETSEKILQPEGDPFEYLLRLMLQKDTIQCTAWKDEVENILIFAGLFSAVVTAFIIESYQRLQPDPNDVMFGLLTHIANRLDGPSNNTESVSSIIAYSDFSPSSVDVSINVFWFISLVLSLTVALIGIVALQWLREHQRYNTALKPKETMAILNARLHSLKLWYVPQIFAGLPLLLQGALVLFLAGMVEFLFALRLEVAIPVTLAISAPLIFLVATTILPLLQVYILQEPFRLSINNHVPSPCPYKSPQSLIVLRLGMESHRISKFLASMVTGAYKYIVTIVCIIRKRTGHRLPIFYSGRPHLQFWLRDGLPERISKIGKHDQYPDWVCLDMSWLDVRTIYALSLQMMHRDDNSLREPRSLSRYQSPLPGLYDCTRFFHAVLEQHRVDADLFKALHACIAAHCRHAMDNFKDLEWISYNRAVDRSPVTNICFAFGRFVCNDLVEGTDEITAEFITDVVNDESGGDFQSAVKLLPTAFIASWLSTISSLSNLRNWEEPSIEAGWKYEANKLLLHRLNIRPERLFPMDRQAWLPIKVVSHARHLSGESSWHPILRRQLLTFFQGCFAIKPNSTLVICAGPSTEAYEGLAHYMSTIVALGHISDAFEDLTQLCTSCDRLELIQERPFLLIAACFYLHEAIRLVDDGRHEPLLNVILEACGTMEGNLSRTNGWTGLDDAVKAIHRQFNPSANNSSISDHFTSPNGNDDNV